MTGCDVPPDPWIGAVGCRHRAVLARSSTVAAWTSPECCPAQDPIAEWQLGVDAATSTDTLEVQQTIAALRSLALPPSATLARLSREDLPPCSILLSDGQCVAALVWGRPLGLVEIDRWEYAVTSSRQPGAVWSRLESGTLIDLADCGPTFFSLPCPHTAKESA